MKCPKCQVALEESCFGEVPIMMCGQCMGAVVSQRHLVPLLAEMSAELAHTINFDRPLEPLVREAEPCDCPKCGSDMEQFGYMESRLVYADRCGGCWQIWATADELGHMAVVYARTQRLTGVIEANYNHYMDGLGRRVSALLLARTRGERIARGLT